MNGYFQLIIDDRGTLVKLVPPTDGGSPISIKEITSYLQREKVTYDLKTINEEINSLEGNEKELFLMPTKILPVSESSFVAVSPDKMTATVRFYPPSSNGKAYRKDDIISDLKLSKVVFGINDKNIDMYLSDRQYCTDYILAEGKKVREGTDAVINYFFETSNKVKPTLLEDGSVDFKNLNVVNHCKQDDLLAELIPEDHGEAGNDVMGNVIKPRDVKRLKLQYGRNIKVSEDNTKIYSEVNGHVSLVDGKVFVADVLEVENVDNSTGNLIYEGNIKINGNVCSGFMVTCNGNIEVRGTVEGAELTAGGNIILSRGINGMGRGKLVAGGNIIAKFLENCTVESGGYVETDSILHSYVQAKTEVNVLSKKGFITGGTVTATNSIKVKTLGSSMGGSTEVNVGIDPEVVNRYANLNEEINMLQKNLKVSIPVLEATQKKIATGNKLSPEQIKQLQALAQNVKSMQENLSADAKELEMLKDVMDSTTQAKIEVTGEVFAGTKVCISDVSMIVKDSFKYCRFTKEQGVVKMGPL